MAGEQPKRMERGALLALLVALSEPDGIGNGKAAKGPAKRGRKGRRGKAKSKYQSKKNKSLKWAGRGMTPIWMREEMKGAKLKKEDFAIK